MKAIIIAALKGGVGKTTIAVGLAKALYMMGLRVGILDLDYRNPEVLIALGTANSSLGRTSSDGLVPPIIEGISVVSMAMIWPPTKAVLVEDENAILDVQQLLTPGVIAWPELDMLVYDSPPTSSGISVVALTSPTVTGAVAVTQPSALSKAALLRTLDLFSEKQIPIYGILSNQGMDEEGRQRYDLQDQDIIDLAARYGLPWCFCIPHTRDLTPHFDGLAQCILSTQPVLLAKPKEPQGVAWDKIITLAQKLTGPTPSAKS